MSRQTVEVIHRHLNYFKNVNVAYGIILAQFGKPGLFVIVDSM